MVEKCQMIGQATGGNRPRGKSNATASAANSKKTFEHIIEQNKANRKINEQTLLNKVNRSKVTTKSNLDTSQMSLTEFYMSRSQCDASKFAKSKKGQN